MNAELLRALTRNELGHVQLHHPSYPQSRSLRDALVSTAALESAIREDPGAVQVTSRVYGFALLSADGKSVGVEIVGVNPDTEREVTTLHEQVVAGRYLDADPTPWPRGRTLTADEKARDEALTEAAEAAALAEIEGLDGVSDGESRSETLELAAILSPEPTRPPRVFVGESVAKVLGVNVGDSIHATGQTADGQSEEVFLEVVGTFRTGSAALDRGRVYLHLADMQRFIHLHDGVHEISVLAEAPEQADALAKRIRSRVHGEVLARSWSEIRPDIQKMLDMSEVGMMIMIFIIFFVAALGVVNTMLMAVFERTRELGMLKAIGMSGRRIVGLIVAETLVLVVVFAAVGAGLGILLGLKMVSDGIDLRGFTEGFSVGGVGIAPVFHGKLTLRGVLTPALVLALTCVAASLYPAMRAARLRPAVGMRDT